MSHISKVRVSLFASCPEAKGSLRVAYSTYKRFSAKSSLSYGEFKKIATAELLRDSNLHSYFYCINSKRSILPQYPVGLNALPGYVANDVPKRFIMKEEKKPFRDSAVDEIVEFLQSKGYRVNKCSFRVVEPSSKVADYKGILQLSASKEG